MRITFQEEICKGCELCAAACARKLIAPRPYLNALGYHPAGLSGPAERCNGCGLCAIMCPDLAITISEEVTA